MNCFEIVNSRQPITNTILIHMDTGGDLKNNTVIFQNIPKTYLTNQILDLALNGTPIIIFGNGSKPRVFIVAGVHGNEFPPQIAVMKLIDHLAGRSVNGTVYIIPAVSPLSTANNNRFWNGKNLNKIACFSGTPTNNVLKLALLLKVDALADFHSTTPGSDPGRDSALCTINPQYESYKTALYISQKTGSEFIPDSVAGEKYAGALEDVSNLNGIPAVTCEVQSPHSTVAQGSVDKSFKQMIAFLEYHQII